MIIRERAYARAGLIGNPSDGYFGRTTAFTFNNFSAETVLYKSRELEILPNNRDRSIFENIGQLAANVDKYGYYGGVRLMYAAVKRFHDFCRRRSIALASDSNFSLRYYSNIPHQVGMAGSSAIITSCVRALMRFYNIEIAPEQLANLVLSVENDELGITAGLQDRVAQAYQGLVYMDFDRRHMEESGFGRYEPLPIANLPPIYLAYLTRFAESSDKFHNDIRTRWEMGDPPVVEAMQFWADLTDRFRAALLDKDHGLMAELINANFDQRCKIYRINPDNMAMVKAARSLGASAKFTGSGGAIVGTYKDEAMFQALVKKLSPMHIKVIKPYFI